MIPAEDVETAAYMMVDQYHRCSVRQNAVRNTIEMCEKKGIFGISEELATAMWDAIDAYVDLKT